MTFRIGQKVVCIASMSEERAYDEVYPEVGVIYTIRELRLSERWKGHVVMRLVEIRNQPKLYCNGVTELWFHETRFRPVVERETDISALKALLVPGAKIREPA